MHKSRFFALLSLFTFTMLILVTGENLLVILLGWEKVGLVSYLLVNFWYTRIAANKASMSALFLNKIGDLFFMLAIVFAIGMFSDLSLSTIFSLISHLNGDLIFLFSLFFIGAAAAKSALIPQHCWLPKAKEGRCKHCVNNGNNKKKSKGLQKYKNEYRFAPLIKVQKRNYGTYKKDLNLKLPIKPSQYLSSNSGFPLYKFIYDYCVNLPPHNLPNLDHITPQFMQWLVGFTEAEGTFGIYNYNLFQLKLHIDELPLIEYIRDTLRIGTIYIEGNLAIYRIIKKADLLSTIIPIFDLYSLQGTKLLDYINFRTAILSNNKEVIKNKKSTKNSNRTNFLLPENHVYNITPLYLLGFTEGDGSFITKGASLRFVQAQHLNNEPQLRAKMSYFINLGTKFGIVQNPDYCYKDSKLVFIQIRAMDLLCSFFLPFFKGMLKFKISRKQVDFHKWSIAQLIKKFGYFTTERGRELYERIGSNTNNRRLSTYKGSVLDKPTQKEVNTLLKLPRIFNQSLNHYENTQNIQRVGIIVLDLDGNEIVGSPFKSQGAAAKFLGIPDTTFRRYVKSGNCWNNKYKFIIIT